MEALTRGQLGTLYNVSAGNVRDNLMIRLSYEHAMRATEVCSLRVRDFDITTGVIYLHLQRLKGSEFTVQPLMPETATFLLNYIKGKDPNDYLFSAGDNKHKADSKTAVPHISRIRFYQIFKGYCELAGIPRHLSHPHAAKHGLASTVINEIGIQATRKYCGHVSIRSTQAYLHSSDASASAAVHAVLGAGL